MTHIKCQKKPSGIWNRKRKAGTKRSTRGVSDVGKEERKREREGERNEIHFSSSRKYKLAMYIYSVPSGIECYHKRSRPPCWCRLNNGMVAMLLYLTNPPLLCFSAKTKLLIM